MKNEIKSLLDRIIAFRNARDWKKFHSPRNLATALASEVGEILEVFRRKSDMSVTDEEKEKLKGEIADVNIFLLYLSDSLGFDIEKITNEKMDINESRYSVEKSRGKSEKYNKL